MLCAKYVSKYKITWCLYDLRFDKFMECSLCIPVSPKGSAMGLLKLLDVIVRPWNSTHLNGQW